MKKYLFLLFLGVFFISSASAVISRNLSVGSTGSDVLELQSELGVKPTGYYGNLTKQAVKAWQMKNNLPNSGYFGILSKKIWNFGTSIDPERLPPIPEDFCTYVKGTVIRVLSPNGGETYQAGQQITVKWKTCNIPAGTNVSIQLLRQNVDSQYNSPSYYGQAVVVQTVSNSGSYSWTIPNSVPDGTNYLIDINGSLTGQEGSGFLDRSDNTFSINSKISTTLDSTPRVAMWYGKVNQHIDEKGNWITDPDGVSGAGTYSQWGSEGYGDRKLEYCKKFYPNTISVADYKTETINSWRERNNVGGPYTLAVMTTKCVQGTVSVTPSITVLSPNGGETYLDGQRVTLKWESRNISKDTLLNLSLIPHDPNNNTLAIGSVGLTVSSPNDGEETIILPTIRSMQTNGISGYEHINFGKNFKILIGRPDPNTLVDMSDNLFTINSQVNTVVDTTPRVAMWYGKVNQHFEQIDMGGEWMTDGDGVSGANLDKLTYCKKFYPNTISTQDYKTETITGWRERGNTGGPYTLAVMTTKCVFR